MDKRKYIEMKSIRQTIIDHSWRCPLLAIYQEPEDYTEKKYIARLYNGKKPTIFVVTGDTIEEIRSKIPYNMVLIPRYYNDVPCLVECWI